MKMQVLYIRDLMADCVPFVPMYVHHIGAAIRDFGDQCKKRDTTLGAHPEHYELWHYGEWDDVEAVFTPLPQKKQIAVGANYTD